MPALHIEFCCTYKFVLTPHRNMIIAPTIARKHSNASVVFEVHCWGITWIWKWSLFVINHKKSVYFNQSNIVLFMKMIALGTGNSHDCGPLPVHTITPPRNEHWHKKKFVLIKKGRFQKRERERGERGYYNKLLNK